ncbi:MAG: PDZ domain-containing protein [Pirellulaceae bacterium]
MKLPFFKLAVAVAVLACPWWIANAQDPSGLDKQAAEPASKKAAEQIKEYEQSLESIHARASRVKQWNSQSKAVWSEKQCRSCHTSTHAFLQESQLLLSRNTVANPLGIEVAPLEITLRAHLQIDETSGLVLASVPEGCEGDKLGLKPHDVVLSIAEQPINEAEKFNRMLQDLQGKKVQFRLLREGRPIGLEIAVPKMPQAMVLDLGIEHLALASDRYRIGVTLSEADDTLRSHLKLASGEGLVVTEVVDDSPAAKMGVKLHDVLIELDGKRLTSVDAINGQIQEIKEKTVLLKLLRSGQEVTCQIAPKKSNEVAQYLSEIVLVNEQTRHPAVVRWFTSGAAPSESDAAAQLAELKKQLAELSKTVEKLEAVIAPPAPPAEEKEAEGNPEKK